MQDSHVSVRGLAKRLVADNHINMTTAIHISEEAQNQQQSFVSLLVNKKIVAAHVVANLVSQDFGLPLLDLDSMDMRLLPQAYMNEKLIIKYHALPLYQRGAYLSIALADPSYIHVLHEFKFHSGLHCLGIIVEEDKLSRYINEVFNRQSVGRLATLDELRTNPTQPSAINDNMDDAPLVRYLNQLLQDAIQRGVSDIHFEPYEHHYRIRFRHDGILYPTTVPAAHLAPRICASIKVMAKLDIAERRLPQDGQFSIHTTKKQTIHCRVSTCPTTTGEKVVIRILDPDKLILDMDSLGFDKDQHELVVRNIHRSQGLILVVGPTGSGKTVTLYAALNLLNTAARNITTIEDPVEINLPGLNQVNVHRKAGLSFQTALRAFLRQDPDVIMVGEIRDFETADIAIKAAQTGHLVLSTLHTLSAAETLTRFMHMGVAPFHLANAIKLIVAQRLVRRLCPHCRQPESMSVSALLQHGLSEADIGKHTLYRANANGCEHCQYGFHGQIGLYELLLVDEAIENAILAGSPAQILEKIAVAAGMRKLRLAGMDKVFMGLTSIEEVLRVTEG